MAHQKDGCACSNRRALEPDQIHTIVASFAAAASAGRFGGVQILAAHGYLISRFLSPRSNQRADE
ncbi:hypothetical protein [Nocardia sp. NPDC051463]|uniref:oxidoreductase n=1 Tax=Nocardia sp. NPDC051463 TaxID=3154845 RepID=UPI00344D01FD